MSLQNLMSINEITVFEVAYSQDNMMALIETQSTRRRKIKCRMVPMDRAEKQLHGIPIMEEVYRAFFFVDPELTLKHMAIFDGKTFDIESLLNLSGLDWAWEAVLRHHPGLQISV